MYEQNILFFIEISLTKDYKWLINWLNTVFFFFRIYLAICLASVNSLRSTLSLWKWNFLIFHEMRGNNFITLKFHSQSVKSTLDLRFIDRYI